MKNILTSFLGLLIGVSLMAQQTYNDADAEVREVKGFSGVKVATGIQLVLTQGTTEAVAISAVSKEDRDRIKTTVENGVLKIHYDYDVWKLMKGKINKKLRAYVSIVNVNSLGATSGASLKVDGEITSDNLNVRASSGGMVKGKIKAKTVSANQSSGGMISLSGTADNIDIDGSSGGVFDGYDLVANSCNAETSSGAVAKITVNKEISGRASSGGRVSYKGDGTIRSKRTSSGGSVGKGK
jgi:hypothetical protein